MCAPGHVRIVFILYVVALYEGRFENATFDEMRRALGTESTNELTGSVISAFHSCFVNRRFFFSISSFVVVFCFPHSILLFGLLCGVYRRREWLLRRFFCISIFLVYGCGRFLATARVFRCCITLGGGGKQSLDKTDAVCGRSRTLLLQKYTFIRDRCFLLFLWE